MATTALWTDVHFQYEVNRSVTTVPRAVNVITCCEGLRTRMRLTGEPIVRDRLNLGSTILYNQADLAKWFIARGFDLMWSRRREDIGLFLLRRE